MMLLISAGLTSRSLLRNMVRYAHFVRTHHERTPSPLVLSRNRRFRIEGYLILFCFFSLNLYGAFEYDRAIIKGKNNDWNSSKELMKKVLVDNPESPTILYDAGVSSFKAGEYDQALSYFTKAAQSNTDRILQEQSLFNAGNSYVKLKKLPEALAAYDKVLDLNPSNERAAHNKEIVKKMMEQEKQQQQKNDENNQDKKDQEKDQNQEENKDKKSSEQQKKENEQQEQEKNKKEKEQNQEQKNNQQSDQQKQENKKQQQQEQNQQKDAADKSDKKEQNSQKESQQQQQKKDEQAAQNQAEKQSGADQKEGQQKSAAEKKLSASLARILEQHEKKDAALNKKMIQVMVNQEGGAGNDEHAY